MASINIKKSRNYLAVCKQAAALFALLLIVVGTCSFTNKKTDQSLKSAENVDTLYQLGMKYCESSEMTKGISYLEQAAKLGNVDALYQLGYVYYGGYRDEDLEWVEETEKGISYLEQAAKLGNAEASYLLGYAYYSGNGVKRDLTKGISYLKQAIEQGNENAEEILRKAEKTEQYNEEIRKALSKFPADDIRSLYVNKVLEHYDLSDKGRKWRHECEYKLIDITGNGIPELWIFEYGCYHHGGSSAEESCGGQYSIYTYQDNALKYLCSKGLYGNTFEEFFYIRNTHSIMVVEEGKGPCWTKMTYDENKKIETETIWALLDHDDDYNEAQKEIIENLQPIEGITEGDVDHMEPILNMLLPEEETTKKEK